MQTATTVIRFPQGMFSDIRARLLQDKDREAFAMLLGRRTTVGNQSIIKVTNLCLPGPEDYEDQSLCSLRIKREFVYEQLVKMQLDGTADTLIDVHTHPFCGEGVAFSGVDDQDERDFHRWLAGTLDGVHYASIVLSNSDYSARTWESAQAESVAHPARVKCQTVSENWPCADVCPAQDVALDAASIQSGFLGRSALALGLDNMRKVMTDQTIGIVGVGGLGSVIAENLIHSGFQTIHLFDPDRVEVTNLNRIVGAYYSDAEANRPKAEVVQNHLQRINPKASVFAHILGVEDEASMSGLIQCDWIVVATDNHFSRYQAQKIAVELAIPLISAGVNISVEGDDITDMSGEVIIARSGDGLCLNCLGRISPTAIAADLHQGEFIGDELVRKGYVKGREVKEPAVKTLNAIVGAMAADALLNQYTERQVHNAILVYENNGSATMFSDSESVNGRHLSCFTCS